MGEIGTTAAGVNEPVARRPEPFAVLAAHVTFPGLIIAMVVGNQLWAVQGLYLGQIISWGVDLAALVIVAHEFRRSVAPYLLGALIVAARLAGSGTAGSGVVDQLYGILLNVLFCVAGVVMARRNAGRVLKQVRWICLLSTIFMVLQVLGVGEWVQVLATENEGRPKTAQPTLFVKSDEIQYQTIQGRPSGLLHSNNFLSAIVLFGMGLNLANRHRRKLNRWDVTFALMAVLSMAKIVFLVTALMVLWLFMIGTQAQRARMRRFALLLVAMLLTYRYLFPGLWAGNLAEETIRDSVYYRVNDFVERMGADNPIRKALAPYLEGTPRLIQYDVGAGLSGYAHLIRVLPYLVFAAAAFVPTFFLGWLRLRRLDPTMSSATLLIGIFAVLYPGAVPLLASQIFWFMAGFAMLPLAMLAMPTLQRRRRRVTRVPAVQQS